MLIIGTVVAGAVAGLFVPGLVRRAPAGDRLLARPDRPRQDGWLLVAAVAALWGALAAVLGSSADLPAFLYLAWLGVALGAIDIRCHRLPDVLVLPSYPIAGVLLGMAAVMDSDVDPIARAFASALISATFYYVLALLRPGGIGLGDVKLAGILGLYLGWLGWAQVATGTLLAFCVAAATAAVLLAARRTTWTSRLPFGPFMLAGTFVAVLLGAADSGPCALPLG